MEYCTILFSILARCDVYYNKTLFFIVAPIRLLYQNHMQKSKISDGLKCKGKFRKTNDRDGVR